MKNFVYILLVTVGLYMLSAFVSGQIFGYTAGIDYPNYSEVPKGGSFSCQNRLPGYYADMETRCQVWHWCVHSGHQYSFLCPNGTVFNQAVRVCDWFFNVNCEQAEEQYTNNDELYKDAQGNPI
ncbi:hypothetical protein PVAND_008320 [Polypedilum vanderplanki]|uniref:Chitin-binding type-2 domain-containing protein n=1 Tax=Polypedilum vanderplanki TaxID=319348 RepID=A0A9J6CA79_POLVA|nr:hypothetical protein PVAND_008320 [Polypedilum vanderplanki]